MQKLIKGQIKMRIVLLLLLFLYMGCSSARLNSSVNTEVLSCSQKAEPKSLQYLEQQYRCSSK